jgi:hypothetical protein
MHVLRELCAEIFEEQLAGNGFAQAAHEIGVTRCSANGSTTGITPCWSTL